MDQRKVVSCYLMGGLGNQLFQIFSTLAYGMRTNRTVFFPYTEVLEVGISRPTYWGSFLNSLLPFTLYNRRDYTNASLTHFPRFNESGFRYSEIPNFTVNPEVLLVGYFQSYKYFDAYRDELFKLIRLQSQLEQAKTTYLNYFTFDHTISMHFRLGDYKAIQDAHPLMTYEYYRKALNYILSYRNQKIYRVLFFCEKEVRHFHLSPVARLFFQGVCTEIKTLFCQDADVISVVSMGLVVGEILRAKQPDHFFTLGEFFFIFNIPKHD